MTGEERRRGAPATNHGMAQVQLPWVLSERSVPPLVAPPAASVSGSSYAAVDAAAPASRIMAAAIDGALLLAVNIAVLYFTLRLCGLTALEIFQLPAAPLLAFFFLLDGGYFVAFTPVGGPSLGKKALGV